VNKITCPKLLPALLVVVAGLLILPATNSGQTAFADSNEEPTILVSDTLKKNPLAMKIIAEMEAQKLRYKQLSEEKLPEIPLTKKQVSENGGSFYEAQQEYFKYASMPRLEMISYIQELNIKYGFADSNIQSNFDANGTYVMKDMKSWKCVVLSVQSVVLVST